MRLDRDSYMDVNFKAIREYEIALNLRKDSMKKNFLRCDQQKIGKKRGCQKIGEFDGDGVLMYPPTLTAQVLENGQHVEKIFTAYTLKDSAHALCENGRCNPGQRDGLSRRDITDIETLYRTTCSKKIIILYIICIK